MTNNLKPLVYLLFSLLSLSALAGGNVENGGDGVLINGKMYSLDLVEYGLDAAPYLGETDFPTPSTNSLVSEFFGQADGFPQDIVNIVSKKIARLEHLSPALFRPVAETLSSYGLILIRAPLKNVDDTESPVAPGAVYQLASHDAANIRINRDGFAQMDTGNQAALVLHEILYASFSTDTISVRARAVNAALFNPKFGGPAVEHTARTQLAWRMLFGIQRSLDLSQSLQVEMAANTMEETLRTRAHAISTTEANHFFYDATFSGFLANPAVNTLGIVPQILHFSPEGLVAISKSAPSCDACEFGDPRLNQGALAWTLSNSKQNGSLQRVNLAGQNSSAYIVRMASQESGNASPIYAVFAAPNISTVPPLPLTTTAPGAPLHRIANALDILCAIVRSNVYCWQSVLSDKYYNTREDHLLPVPSGIHNPREIALSNDSACVIADEGVQCWNLKNWNNLGALWGRPDISAAVPKYLTNPRQLETAGSGLTNFCVTADEGIICWGDETKFHSAHTFVASGGTVRSVMPLYAYGSSEYYFSYESCYLLDSPYSVHCPNDFSSVASGNLGQQLVALTMTQQFLCGLGTDGAVRCAQPKENSLVAFPAGQLRNPRKLFADAGAVCALDDDGVKCAGVVSGDDNPKYDPRNRIDPIAPWNRSDLVDASESAGPACGLTKDEQVVCGDGSSKSPTQP